MKLLIMRTYFYIIFVTIALFYNNATTKPLHQSPVKRSGISDQRLAELETLLELQRLREKLRTRPPPIAYGLVDPAKIGRRKKRNKATNLKFVEFNKPS
jgi:hypothetical protein